MNRSVYLYDHNEGSWYKKNEVLKKMISFVILTNTVICDILNKTTDRGWWKEVGSDKDSTFKKDAVKVSKVKSPGPPEKPMQYCSFRRSLQFLGHIKSFFIFDSRLLPTWLISALCLLAEKNHLSQGRGAKLSILSSWKSVVVLFFVLPPCEAAGYGENRVTRDATKAFVMMLLIAAMFQMAYNYLSLCYQRALIQRLRQPEDTTVPLPLYRKLAVYGTPAPKAEGVAVVAGCVSYPDNEEVHLGELNSYQTEPHFPSPRENQSIDDDDTVKATNVQHFFRDEIKLERHPEDEPVVEEMVVGGGELPGPIQETGQRGEDILVVTYHFGAIHNGQQ